MNIILMEGIKTTCFDWTSIHVLFINVVSINKNVFFTIQVKLL